jgi:hypothetical protein
VFHVENRVFLSHGVQVAGATWQTAIKIVTEVGDLLQRTGDGHTDRILGGRMIGRSGDTMCGLYRAHENENSEFLG